MTKTLTKMQPRPERRRPRIVLLDVVALCRDHGETVAGHQRRFGRAVRKHGLHVVTASVLHEILDNGCIRLGRTEVLQALLACCLAAGPAVGRSGD